MEYQKKLDVILLPTESKSLISKGLGTKSLFFCPNGEKYDETAEEYQSLNLFSDGELSYGDWFYAGEGSKIEQAKHFEGKLVNGFIKSGCKKLEATCDLELIKLGIPLISEKFVQKYIDQDRLNNIITETMVEWIFEPSVTWGISGDFRTREINKPKLSNNIIVLVGIGNGVEWDVIIARVEKMIKLEREHLEHLQKLKASSKFISNSENSLTHLETRLKEYKEYAEGNEIKTLQ